ncbi:MAG: hypothetical protein L3J95_02335 [Thermoplasmata archaeon]|nr:hypothetical protein [Thermoplasmata archaeon]MCI4359245.1 hypothetical protein [Thermoplasmata archaeon]
MRRAPAVHLVGQERRRLVSLVRAHATPSRIAFRARVVLMAADGLENRLIAKELRSSSGTVGVWRKRFLMQRIPGIEKDAPRPGRPPFIPTSTIQLIVRASHGRSSDAAAQWSARRLAKSFGVSKTTVLRVWKAHRISRSAPGPPVGPAPTPVFADKVSDFVGLYLNPPERAMAFSVDERTREPAPVRPARTASGSPPRDPALEFRTFLQAVDRETPKLLDVHLLVDSRLTASAPSVRRWLVGHPRFYLHLLPSGRSPPNLIDRLLREFTRKRIRPATPESAARLHGAVKRYFGTLDGSQGPFIWTATADEIRTRSASRPNTAGYYWTSP